MGGFWEDRRVLVTGAAGFIGSHLVDALLLRGAEVTAVTRRASRAGVLVALRAATGRLVVTTADLVDPEACHRVCRGQEVVFSVAHMDGGLAFKQQHPASIFSHNIAVTLNLLEASRHQGVERMVVMSSSEVYGDAAWAPSRSDTAAGAAPDALDGYAWSKRMSEFAAGLWEREYGLKVGIARAGNVYGPRDQSQPGKVRVIPNFITQALEERAPILIWGTGEQIRTFLFVEDLARGLLDLAERYPVADPVDFAGTQPISVRELAEMVVRLSGSQVGVVCDPSRPSGADKRMPDTTRAERILGFRPTVSLEEGLQRTIAAHRADIGAGVARS
jgi:nucleoside-diphosphate-sugar epimerase